MVTLWMSWSFIPGTLTYCCLWVKVSQENCKSYEKKNDYRKTSGISRALVGNKIVGNSDVVGASPVGAAPTTSSFST